jgi:hypothetical protein
VDRLLGEHGLKRDDEAEWPRQAKAWTPTRGAGVFNPVFRLMDKPYGEVAKASARKIVLEGNIQDDKPEEKITQPADVNSLLHN